MNSRISHAAAGIVVVALLLAALFTLVPSRVIDGHANQIRSSPAPSEELETAPDRVIIWFTEPIEPSFSSISVLNQAGAEMATDVTRFDPTEPQAMWVPLSELQNGTYTVVWRNVSSIDGHRVFGSYLFAVGEPLGIGAEGASIEQPIVQAGSDPFIRWIIYIGAALLFGGLVFELVVVGAVSGTLQHRTNLITFERTSRAFAMLAYLAVTTVVIGLIGQLMQQASIVYDVAWFSLRPGQLSSVVLESEWGIYWSFRLTFIVVAGFCLFMAHKTRVWTGASDEHATDADEEDAHPGLLTDSLWGIFALGATALFLIFVSLSGHNAATPVDVRWIAIIGDVSHLFAASIWSGGLVFLLATLTIHSKSPTDADSRLLTYELVSRFTPLALLAAVVLVSSGLLSALMQVTIPEALSTPYGFALSAKVFLALALLGIAAVNMLSLARRLRVEGSTASALNRNVAAEIVIICLALLAAAWMASLEPARQYAERKGIGVEQSVAHEFEVDGLGAAISLEPGEVGANTLEVLLTNIDGTPFERAQEVRARVKFLDQEFGEPYLPIEQTDDGVWRKNDVQIGVGGAYQVEVNVTRTDAFDTRLSFRFSARSTTVASDLIRPDVQTAHLFLALQIFIIGVAILATSFVRSQRFTLDLRQFLSTNRTLVVVAGAFIGFGGLFLVNAVTLGVGMPRDETQNPFPLTQESVSIGRPFYVSTCQTCHGETGKGDGPASSGFNPAPSDLAVHVPLHSDADLFDFVANGIEGTAMVPQLGNLSEEEIWHLVNFIRTFGE